MSVYCSRCTGWVEAEWLPEHTILKCGSCLHAVPRVDRLASELSRIAMGHLSRERVIELLNYEGYEGALLGQK